MGSVTFYLLLFVSLVQFQLILCKPFLFDFLCDLVCDDDDNTTAKNSSDDYFGFDDMCSCGPPVPAATGIKGKPPNVDLNLPGISLQMSNTNGQWSLNVNANPSTPANSVIPLPSGGSTPPFPGSGISGLPGLGMPGMPGVPGAPGAPGAPGIPPGVPTPASASTAAATTAAPASAAPA